MTEEEPQSSNTPDDSETESRNTPADSETESGAPDRASEVGSDPRVEIGKTLIKSAAAVIVAGIGLLGPITTAVTKLYELQLTSATSLGTLKQCGSS